MNRTALAAALATILTATTMPASASTATLTVYSGDFDSVSQSEGQPGGSGFALRSKPTLRSTKANPEPPG